MRPSTAWARSVQNSLQGGVISEFPARIQQVFFLCSTLHHYAT